MGINSLEEVYKNFLDFNVISISPIEAGHINDTYLVKTKENMFILQRIQKAIDILKLEYNYELYSKAFDEVGFLYPKWIRSKTGELFYTDTNGYSWRMYPFVEGDILSTPLSDRNLYSLGQGLAKMHQLLSKVSDVPKAVYPRFHDLNFYYEQYLEILNNSMVCNEKRAQAIEEKIKLMIDEMLLFQPVIKTVIHADPKLTNVLFKDGRVIGVLDLDTVMEGAVLEDIADCIRSCCIVDGEFSNASAEIMVEGYKSNTTIEIAKEIDELLPDCFNKICFELGLRYYMDYISHDEHFKEIYPGYRRDRAKSLLEVRW